MECLAGSMLCNGHRVQASRALAWQAAIIWQRSRYSWQQLLIRDTFVWCNSRFLLSADCSFCDYTLVLTGIRLAPWWAVTQYSYDGQWIAFKQLNRSQHNSNARRAIPFVLDCDFPMFVLASCPDCCLFYSRNYRRCQAHMHSAAIWGAFLWWCVYCLLFGSLQQPTREHHKCICRKSLQQNMLKFVPGPHIYQSQPSFGHTFFHVWTYVYTDNLYIFQT